MSASSRGWRRSMSVPVRPATANEYILHHLTFLSNKEPAGIVDFSVVHWDSVFFSVLLAVVFAGSFYLAARKATASASGSSRPGNPASAHA